jgi:hypothetical protein
VKLFPKASHRILEDGAKETTVDTGGVVRRRVPRQFGTFEELQKFFDARGQEPRQSPRDVLAHFEAHVSACLRLPGLRPELENDALALLLFIHRAVAALKRGDREDIAARCLDVGQRFAFFELRRMWEPSVAVHRSMSESPRPKGPRKGSISWAILEVHGWEKLAPREIFKKVKELLPTVNLDSFNRELARVRKKRKNSGH